MKSAEPSFPLPSDAWHDTVVAPTGKVVPAAGVHATGTVPSTASDADASKATSAPAPDVAATVRSPGVAIEGAVVSTTSTSKEPTAALPDWSRAEQSTVVRPMGRSTPLSGAQRTATGPWTRSAADAR